MLGDRVDLIGVVVKDRAPGHAWAGAVAVGLDRDEPVALGPEREDLLPLASAAHAAVEEHHRRACALLDNLHAAPQRRPECDGSRHSGDRVNAAAAGFLEKTKLLAPGARGDRHGHRSEAPAAAALRFSSCRSSPTALTAVS